MKRATVKRDWRKLLTRAAVCLVLACVTLYEVLA